MEYPNKAPEAPLVSVCIQTYNHAPYIVQCIEGALMQETDFPYEIIIGEDESTDGTREICIEYAKKYPEKIRLFLRREEDKIWINGVKTGRFNFLENLKVARGKYVAMCEGDDYWVDEEKLHKQVTFLEKNTDYTICYHQVKIEKEGVLIDDYITKAKPKTTTIQDLAEGNYIHTPSCTFRKQIESVLGPNFNKVTIADYYLHMMNAQFGKIYFMSEPMAVYRVHDNSFWSSKDKEYRTLKTIESIGFIILDLSEEHQEAKNILFRRYYNAILNLFPPTTKGNRVILEKYLAPFNMLIVELEIKASQQLREMSLKSKSLKNLGKMILSESKKRIFQSNFLKRF